MERKRSIRLLGQVFRMWRHRTWSCAVCDFLGAGSILRVRHGGKRREVERFIMGRVMGRVMGLFFVAK